MYSLVRKHHEDSIRNPWLNILESLIWLLTLEHGEMRMLLQNVTIGDKHFVLPAQKHTEESQKKLCHNKKCITDLCGIE